MSVFYLVSFYTTDCLANNQLIDLLPGPSRPQGAIKIGCGSAVVDEEVCASNESSLVAHQQFRHIGYLVGRAGAAGGALGKHILIEIPAGALELINGKRCDDDARRDAPRSPHFTDSAITRFSLQRLASW